MKIVRMATPTDGKLLLGQVMKLLHDNIMVSLLPSFHNPPIAIAILAQVLLDLTLKSAAIFHRMPKAQKNHCGTFHF